MKRIGILTAGGDTPALNATIHGAATRANQLKSQTLFAAGNLAQPYHSINTDVHKRIRYLEREVP